jgi:hypothetical protein
MTNRKHKFGRFYLKDLNGYILGFAQKVEE